jgi:hypothetical protein
VPKGFTIICNKCGKQDFYISGDIGEFQSLFIIHCTNPDCENYEEFIEG